MHERIEINPAIQHGRPVIRGTRVPVEMLVSLLEGGDERSRIAYELGVTEDDVDAALVYDRIESTRRFRVAAQSSAAPACRSQQSSANWLRG